MRKILFLLFFCSLHITAQDKAVTQYPPVPDEIKTSDYHNYTDCKLLKVEPDGVVITHKLGVAKLMFASMPVDFQKAYGYDPIAAQKAIAVEITREEASDAQMMAYNKKIQQEKALDQNTSADPKENQASEDYKKWWIARVAFLKQDIAEKKSLKNHEAIGSYSTGAYATIISDDEAELSSLGAK